MSIHSMTVMKLNAKGHLISNNCDTITAQQSYVKKSYTDAFYANGHQSIKAVSKEISIDQLMDLAHQEKKCNSVTKSSLDLQFFTNFLVINFSSGLNDC